jgi:hypothetical protein
MAGVEFHVLYKRRRRGGWTATVREIPGARSEGRTIREARLTLRAALAARGDVGRIDLLEDVKVSAPVRRLLVRNAAARRKAERERLRAREVARRAARVLVSELKLGERDAAELLGLSPAALRDLLREAG